MTSRYRLAIDIGTSNTVAAVRLPDGRIQPLRLEDMPRLPSGVYVDEDGVPHVGQDGLRLARRDPSRYAADPKGRIDEDLVMLGDRAVPVADLVANLLRFVMGEVPTVLRDAVEPIVLTFPATWGPRRRRVFTDAAERAGIAQPNFVSEPVAAAAYFTQVMGVRIAQGQCALVLDLGAGSADFALVEPVLGEFGVRAAGALDDLGGQGLDSRELAERVVAAAHRLVRTARVAPHELVGVLLAGGGSRAPLVARLAQQRFGMAAVVADDPELATAMGCLQLGAAEYALASQPPPAPPRPVPAAPIPPPAESRRSSSGLRVFGVMAAVLAAVGALIAVPQVRELVRRDRPAPAAPVEQGSPAPTDTGEPVRVIGAEVRLDRADGRTFDIAVGDEALYIVVPAGSDQRLVAVDPATGQQRWTKALPAIPSAEQSVRLLVVRDAGGAETVVVRIGSLATGRPGQAMVQAYGATGQRRWERRGLIVLPEAIGAGRLLLAIDDRHEVVDVATGRRVWVSTARQVAPVYDRTTRAAGRMRAGLTVDRSLVSVDAAQVVEVRGSAVVLRDTATGRELRRRIFDTGTGITGVAAVGGVLAVSVTTRSADDRVRVTALRLSDFEPLWRLDVPRSTGWRPRYAVPRVRPCPPDLVCLLTARRDQHLDVVAHRATTGAVVWRAAINARAGVDAANGVDVDGVSGGQVLLTTGWRPAGGAASGQLAPPGSWLVDGGTGRVSHEGFGWQGARLDDDHVLLVNVAGSAGAAQDAQQAEFRFVTAATGKVRWRVVTQAEPSLCRATPSLLACPVPGGQVRIWRLV